MKIKNNIIYPDKECYLVRDIDDMRIISYDYLDPIIIENSIFLRTKENYTEYKI